MMTESMTALITIDDLAARWDVTTSKAWEIVRSRKVPFLTLSGKSSDLNGKGPRPIKFRASAVDRWEQEQQEIWVEPAVAATQPSTVPTSRSATAAARLGLPPKTGR